MPEGILIASGSEVHVAMDAQTQLREQGHDVSVVSMPSFELFDAQSAEYKESVLPSAVTKRVSIELGTTMGWEHYVGLNGIALGINNRFGESGNPQTIIDSFGITPENTADAFLSLVSEKQSVREGQ